MKTLALLGVGSHCRNEHLPALRHLKATRGGDFRLAAVCDLDRVAAEAVAVDLGFERVYTDLNALLATEKLDGIIAVTPTRHTAELTCRILAAGVPVLMEKPLGASLAEAERVVAEAERSGTPVMVGMNRRHDPVMQQAFAWLRDRRIDFARAVIHRPNRREVGFIEDAVLHPVDVLCGVQGGGHLEGFDRLGADGGEAGLARFSFRQARALVEILPACGHWEESYLFAGDGFLLQAVPQKHCTLHRKGADSLSFAAPEGPAGRWTTGETAAFLDALHGHAPWAPSPREVLASMKLCTTIREAVHP